jgi:Flp pilus assembly protein TadG
MQRIAAAKTEERGQTLVESALVLILFLALFIGLFDVGVILFMQQTLSNRAQTAARFGSVNAFDELAVENIVLYGTPHPAEGMRTIFGLTRQNVAAVRVGAGTIDDRVVVTVSGYTVDLISPAIVRLNARGSGGLQATGMSVQASLPCEYPN